MSHLPITVIIPINKYHIELNSYEFEIEKLMNKHQPQ